MATQAQTLTRKLRDAYRRGEQAEARMDVGVEMGDYTTAPTCTLYREAVRYREVTSVEFLSGFDADLMMYADGSVAAFVPAVHWADGVRAVTKAAEAKAAKELLGAE